MAQQDEIRKKDQVIKALERTEAKTVRFYEDLLDQIRKYGVPKGCEYGK